MFITNQVHSANVLIVLLELKNIAFSIKCKLYFDLKSQNNIGAFSKVKSKTIFLSKRENYFLELVY